MQQQKNKIANDLGIYGKVPPNARELEAAILGAVMLERDAFNVASDVLKAECFYIDANQRVFKAMQVLNNRNVPIDLMTVVEQLIKHGELDLVGGPHYVTKLTNSVTSSANIEDHCKIVLEKFIQRELIRISSQTISAAYEDTTDAFELLESTQQLFSGVDNHMNFGEMTGIDTVIVEAIQQIEEWRKNDSYVTGIPCGIEKIDNATRGWQSTDFIILAARPSVGKTAFGLKIVEAAAEYFSARKKGETVAVWSLEMKPVMMVIRMMAARSEIMLQKLLTGKLEEYEMKQLYNKGVQALSKLNIKFDDNSGLTIAKLKSKARQMKRKNNLGLIVIDYLQLMDGEGKKNGTRENDVSAISRALKQLNLELGVPIIALSQLSRDIEKRPSGIPQLSDLRESGAIEQDAETVIMLYAPTEGQIMDNADLAKTLYAKVAKQRNGALLTADLSFDRSIQKFTDVVELTNKFQVPGGSWRPVSSEESKEKEMDF